MYKNIQSRFKITLKLETPPISINKIMDNQIVTEKLVYTDRIRINRKNIEQNARHSKFLSISRIGQTNLRCLPLGEYRLESRVRKLSGRMEVIYKLI